MSMGVSVLSHALVNSSYPGGRAAEYQPVVAPRVSVVIPALNEALNLPDVFGRLGNRALNGLVNLLYGTRHTDPCYGYNAFWRHCFDALELHPGAEEKDVGMRWGDGFEMETIINTRVSRAGLTVTEVPSFGRLRIHGESNLNATRDGLRLLRSILHERWGRRRSVTQRPSRGTLINLAHNDVPRIAETAIR